LLDLPVEMGLRRAQHAADPDRLENESLAFHEKVRAGFLELVRREPARIHLVAADRPRAEIAADVRAVLAPLFPGLDALTSNQGVA
jgi:dTMP kinase